MTYNLLVWYWDKDMAYTNQKVSPTNINYTSKDFSSLKADLIQYITWNDVDRISKLCW